MITYLPRPHEADQAARIPMHPDALASGVDSLNVVAGAAIACHVLVGVDPARSVE